MLGIRPGEGRAVLRSGAHLALALAGTTLHLSASEALFLGAYSARWLPVALMGGAILGIAAGAAHGFLKRRLGAGVVSVYVLFLAAARFLGPLPLLLIVTPGSVLVGIESASLIQRLFDPRAARRLIPAIGVLGCAGTIAGGLAVGALSRLLGPADVAWPAAACLLASIPFMTGGRPSSRRTRARAAGSLLRNRFAFLLVVLVFGMGLLTTLVRVQLGVELQRSLSADRIAGFLGRLNAALSAGAVLFQLLIAPRLLSRLGIGASLTIYPWALSLASIAILAVPGLATATAALSAERLLRQNLQRPVLSVAVLPLPDALRARATSALRGMLEPLAVAAASGVVLATGPAVVPAASCAIAVVLVVGALAARRLYARELESALHARRLRVGEAGELPAPAERLHEQLDSDSPERVILALRLLSGNATDTTLRLVRERWPKWKPDLRAEAVGCLADHPGALEGLDADDPQIRAALIRSGGVRDEEELVRSLEIPEVRGEAMAALLRMGKRDRVRPRLDAWMNEGLPEAALALAARPDPAYAAQAVRYLSDDRTFESARSALLAMGTASREPLLAARTAPAIELLGELEDPSLLDLLRDPDSEIRYRAAKALGRRGTRNRDAILAALEIEIAATGDFDWRIERIFVLLGLLHPDRPLRRMHLSFRSADPRQRGIALEALEEILDPDGKRRILPILESPPPEDPDPTGLRSLALFREWTSSDLALIESGPRRPPWIPFVNGEPLDLERIVAGTLVPDAGRIPLPAIYEAIRRRPRCGTPWLRALARRWTGSTPELADGVSRSFPSLASRSIETSAGSHDLWQRLFLLRSLPLFSDLGPERLRLVAEISSVLPVAEGDLVVREGAAGHHFYVVCSGALEVTSGGRRIALMGEGEAFGELALLTGEPRSATVRARQGGEVLTIERVDFLDLIDTHPGLVEAFSVVLARRKS